MSGKEKFKNKLEKIIGKATSSKVKKRLLKDQILSLVNEYCNEK